MRRHLHLAVAVVATALLAACGTSASLTGPSGGVQDRDQQHEALVIEYVDQ